MFGLIDEVKNAVVNKQGSKALKNNWKQVEDFAVTIDLDHEDKPDKNKLYEKLHDLTGLLVEHGKTDLAHSGGSRKFWWGGIIKILSTKPQKFGCLHRN